MNRSAAIWSCLDTRRTSVSAAGRPNETLWKVLKHGPRPVVVAPPAELSEGASTILAYNGSLQADRAGSRLSSRPVWTLTRKSAYSASAATPTGPFGKRTGRPSFSVFTTSRPRLALRVRRFHCSFTPCGSKQAQSATARHGSIRSFTGAGIPPGVRHGGRFESEPRARFPVSLNAPRPQGQSGRNPVPEVV